MQPLKHIFLTALAGAWLAATGTARAQDNSPEDPMIKPHTFERTESRTLRARYLLFLPKDYDLKGAKRWPLILFLHGAGERGTSLQKVAVHGPPRIVKQRPDFPFVLVSPQCPSGETWSNEVLLGLLDDVLARHRVDSNRVYLTGLSMGGYGTWSLGTAHPERFAAIAPVCGGGETVKVLLAERHKTAALRGLGVWAFHGAKDAVVKLEESERMIGALKKIGCKDVELTVYPEAGHDSWTETYNNDKLYEWFLQHERKPAASEPSLR